MDNNNSNKKQNWKMSTNPTHYQLMSPIPERGNHVHEQKQLFDLIDMAFIN